MTGILRPFALAMVFVAAIGCGGGGDNGPLGPDGDSPISATIDGQAWSAALTPGATIAMRLEGSNMLGITGTDQALRSVNLTIQGVTATGTYALSAPTFNSGAVIDGGGADPATWMSSVPGGSGTATITVLNAERVAGTFEFTALAAPGTSTTGTVHVTNGRFDMAWTGTSGF